MIRLWLLYTAFLAALLMAEIGAITAKVLSPYPADRDSNTVFDADDYVQGLAQHGIAELPGYRSPPAVPIATQ
jgi:hypothetical protein